MARPVLGELELQQVQRIDVEGDQVLDQHAVAALEGDFFQRLGRRATRITLTGVLTSSRDPEEARGLRDQLKALRDKFLAAQPVSFVSDISTATRVDKVLIEEMSIREVAGKPERFEYAFTLREFQEAPEPPTEPPPPIPEPTEASLQVTVEVECEHDIAVDFANVTVSVRGVQDDGTNLSRQLTNRSENIWTEDTFPAGSYTVEATVTTPEAMTSTAQVTVPDGERATVTLTLHCGPQGIPAPTVFRIHFWFDKAFIEPCLRPVMREVAEFATQHPNDKLLIVGHTDKTGGNDYNQSLSERRARSAFAFLTAGRDQNGATTEWDNLRRTASGITSLQDDWTQREAHYMLQDLDFYTGPIDDARRDMDTTKRNAINTDTPPAIRSFQTSKGLPTTGIMDDPTWRALIEAYLAQDALQVPEAQFFPNCDGEILKWLGCGETDPICNTENALRVNRRVEFIFVQAERLPCPVPQPITFDLPAHGAVNNGWCVGPRTGTAASRHCFIKRPSERCYLPRTDATATNCQNPAGSFWCVSNKARDDGSSDAFLVPQPPDAITVRGSIKFGDGSPFANAKFVLLSPVGLFMDGEISPFNNPDRGRPIPGQTDANGEFSYTMSSPEGIYSLEVRGQDPSVGTEQGPFLAHIDGEPTDTARGAVVCKRLTTADPVMNVILLTAASDFDLVVTGAVQVGGASSTEFLAFLDPAGEVVVEAHFPAGSAAPSSSITWSGGEEVAGEPLKRRVKRDAIGQTTVTATMAGVPPIIRTRSIFVVRVTLDVDADRDGVVEQNAEGKANFDFGAGKKGAVILSNNDNDNKPDTTIDNENDVVDGPNDPLDLAPLVVRQSGPLPTGVDLLLHVTDKRRVRVFNQRAAAGVVLVGPGRPDEVALPTAANADLDLGMEATLYAFDATFNGLIDLALILRDTSNNAELKRDSIKVKVAPWVMPSHLQVTREIYVVVAGSSNASFVTDLANIAAPAQANVPLQRIINPRDSAGLFDPWIQDSMEVGYSRMPTQSFNTILNSIRRQGLGSIARNQFLALDVGFARVTTPTPPTTFDSHGNLEVSPPVQVNGKNFKLGRIYFGSGRPTEPFNVKVKQFLEAQQVQKPFALDTSWLIVGHVDEMISFVPSTVGRPFRMLLADTNAAITLLQNLQNNGQGGLKLFTGKPQEETINDMLVRLADTATPGALGWVNNFCQRKLDAAKLKMKNELGLSDADIILIPALFTESSGDGPAIRALSGNTRTVVDALIPGMVNMLVITRAAVSDTHIVMAKPFGPVLNGVDQLEEIVRNLLTPLGYPVANLHFVDDYDFYHLGQGEVHCGTNSRREPHTVPWWEQTDL